MTAGSGTKLYPIDVQQGFMVFGGRMARLRFENPFKVGEGIVSVAAHLLDKGVDDRAAPVAFEHLHHPIVAKPSYGK